MVKYTISRFSSGANLAGENHANITLHELLLETCSVPPVGDPRYLFTPCTTTRNMYPPTITEWDYSRSELRGGLPNSSLTLSDFQIRNATFLLDDTIPKVPDVVPYNSSISWLGEIINLRAPFLDIGKYNGSRCDWLETSLNLCLCLGTPQLWKTGERIRIFAVLVKSVIFEAFLAPPCFLE
jgi:hypothetical protein